MFYAPKHSALRKSDPVVAAWLGVAVAGSATVAGGIAPQRSAPRPPASGTASPPARAAATGRSTPATATTAACSSPSRPGTPSAAARYAVTREPRQQGRSRSPSPRRSSRPRAPAPGRVCGASAGLTRANGGAVAPGRRTRGAAARPQAPWPRRRLPRGKLVVDGVRGPKTNRAIERWVGGSRRRLLVAHGRQGAAAQGRLARPTASSARKHGPRPAGQDRRPQERLALRSTAPPCASLQAYLNAH